MERISDYESEGYQFKSDRFYHFKLIKNLKYVLVV